ncbi:MAG: excisionase family DNA-binding protein [Bacteroidetes bacterium]|nr:excisionase family DNA-binding protein [Bacteroidota bacterium]
METNYSAVANKTAQQNLVVLTVDELVAYTGYKKSYIYKLAHLRKIPHYKPPLGRKLFFSKPEIDAWLLAVKLPTVSEIINH